MMDEDRKTRRTIYDEKPVCGRCGNTITGVVPRFREVDGKPLCRDCIFEIDQQARRPRVRIADEEEPAVSREERIQRTAVWTILVLVFLFLAWRFAAIAPLLQASPPLRHGTYETDALTDACISELWTLSKHLQENTLPESFPACPKSGLTYVMEQEAGDTVIRCPTPEEHGFAVLSVSRRDPVPRVVSGRE